MPRILFRADADPKSGTGDLLSLIYISEYFRTWRKYFIAKDNKTARNIFNKNGIRRVKYIPKDIGIAEETHLLNDYILGNKIDAVFIEITTRKITPYEAIMAPFKACVNFDGVIPRNFDLVINWDVGAGELYDRRRYPDTHFLLGPRYVCLRKEILRSVAKSNRKAKRHKRIKNILVFFGGYDQFNFTLKSIKSLKNIAKDINLNVIVGAGYRRKKELMKCLRGSKFSGYAVKQNINNMLKEYRKADLIVTSGGLSLFEAIALKIPVVAIATYKHQTKRSVFFNKIGIVLYAGFRKDPACGLEKAISGCEFNYFKKAFLADTIPGIVNERLDYKKRF